MGVGDGVVFSIGFLLVVAGRGALGRGQGEPHGNLAFVDHERFHAESSGPREASLSGNGEVEMIR